MILAHKQELVTSATLIAGVDIAKKIHWARFCGYTGRTLGKPLRFENNREGFEVLSLG